MQLEREVEDLEERLKGEERGRATDVRRMELLMKEREDLEDRLQRTKDYSDLLRSRLGEERQWRGVDFSSFLTVLILCSARSLARVDI